MKRIALISEHASPLALLGGADGGGQNVYVAHLARNLAARGFAVDVFTRRHHPELPTITDWQGARVIHVSAGPPAPVRKEKLLPYMGEFTSFLLRFCRRQQLRYDVVHANFFMSALVAMNIKYALEIPFVVSFHVLGRVRRMYHGDADGFPEERVIIEDRAVARADRIIAESPQDREDLLSLYEADPLRLRTVPCGYDPREFGPLPKAKARARLGLNVDKPIILQVGRLVPGKGTDNVIRGVARLRRDHGIEAQLLIVGGESREPDPVRTPEIGKLAEIAREENIADQVTFVGSRGRHELRHYYCAADVFVSTPWYETFGMGPVEAMACGTPVIGSAVGGILSTVRHEETGFLVPPRAPDLLAGRLADLLCDPALLARFGAQALTRARALYTWRRVVADIASIYDEVVHQLPRPQMYWPRRPNKAIPVLTAEGRL